MLTGYVSMPLNGLGLCDCMGSDYHLIDSYFAQFASRTGLPVILYLILTIAVLVLVAVSTAYYIFRTANAKPVLASRYE